MVPEGGRGGGQQSEWFHRPTNGFVSVECSVLWGATEKGTLIQHVGLEEESDYGQLKTIDKEEKMPDFG